jgi:hypothetical protein
MLSITLSRAQFNMKNAGISAATLAKLCGIAASTLSAAYREQVYLGSEKEAEFLTTTLRVQELQESLKPFREPTNVDDLRRVLDFIAATNIEPDKIREALTGVFGVAGSNE